MEILQRYIDMYQINEGDKGRNLKGSIVTFKTNHRKAVIFDAQYISLLEKEEQV